MNNIVKVISLVALGLVVVPCVLFFTGAIALGAVKWLALLGTIGWFIFTPLWMSRKLPVDADQVEI